VLVVSAPALSEKVPDPALRPHSFTLAVGELLDLDECAQTLVEMGYERVGQVEERGQFAIRGGLLDVFGATAERAVRVELFDIEIESLRRFSTFTQRSLESRAHRGRARGRARARAPACIAARRARSAPTSPSCCRSSASSRCWSCRAPRPPCSSPRARRSRRRCATTGPTSAPPSTTRRAGRRGALRSFADLRTGDIVVHEDHGSRASPASTRKTVAGVTRDYLYLEYAGLDRVFVPVDQLAKISRYVGAGGEHPPLSKLGGTRWDTIKARARAAQELAGELLNLYAERKRREGHAFAPDTDWQREFEERFPYTETPDQRDAIEFVKADMEAPRPMDRLICGDVGYGKTEVALRAAFKAVQDGKQVMMLVPTTILAQQHYGTFSERLGLPDHGSSTSRASAARRAEGAIALREGRGRHPDRHPPAALARRARQGPRPADRR
jgi:transcription-repair coupling factor (superfamily II helicase)